MSDIAEAPPVESSAPDLAGLSGAIDQYQKEQANPGLTQDTPETPPAEAPAKALKSDKPAEPPAKSSKKPWDQAKVESAAKAEAEPEAPATEEPHIEAAPKELTPKAAVRWGELRKTEELYKQAKPKLETLQKEVEELRKAPAKIPEEIDKELGELRQFRAAYDVENTPEFNQAVWEPMAKVDSSFKEIADYAKVDKDELMVAADIKNKLQRARAIKDVLAKSTEDIDETVVQEAIQAAHQLHPIYEKAEQLRKDALDIRNAMDGKQKVQSEQQKQVQQQKFQEASREMKEIMATSLKEAGLVDEPMAKAMLEATQADVNEDPQMAAYQVQAGLLLPEVIKLLNKEREERSKLQGVINTRNKANGSTSGRQTVAPPPTEGDIFEDLKQTALATYGGR